MKKFLSSLLTIAILLASWQSYGENVWVHNQQLSAAHMLNNGNFVIWFPDVVNEICQGGGKIMHVYEGQNSVTQSGLTALYSTSMAGVVSKLKVDVKYDNANSSCFVKEVRIKNP